MLNKLPLLEFVLATQDPIKGGMGKNPNAGPDGLHTYLGISGLGVLGLQAGLKEVDPALNISMKAKAHLDSLNMHLRWDMTQLDEQMERFNNMYTNGLCIYLTSFFTLELF